MNQRVKIGLMLAAAGFAAATFLIGQAGAGSPQTAGPATQTPHSTEKGTDVLAFTMNRIDGTPQDLAAYRGKVVLIVNTASKCGLTPQYTALEKLYQSHKDAGFVVLGFPANDFKEQEPGDNDEIAEFCRSNYGVTFPMFEKISVTGEDRHPLYERLSELPEPLGGEPKWNFTKFLVDRSGRVVARFEPRTTPDDPAVVAKVEELVKAK